MTALVSKIILFCSFQLPLLIIETPGGLKNWQSSEKILKKGGIFVTLTGDNEDQKKISIGGLLSSAGTKLGRNIRSSFTGSPQYESILTDPNGRDLTKIAELIESEKIKTVRYVVVPFCVQALTIQFPLQLHYIFVRQVCRDVRREHVRSRERKAGSIDRR